MIHKPKLLLALNLIRSFFVAGLLQSGSSSSRLQRPSCWNDEFESSHMSSFLEASQKPGQAGGMFDLSSPAVQSWNWFRADKKFEDGKSPDKWAEVMKLGITGPGSETKGAGWENAWPGKGLDFALWGPILGEMPGFAGALFGRSLFSGCKCEGGHRHSISNYLLMLRIFLTVGCALYVVTLLLFAACVYSIDTLVMYLDEDTMGMFDEQDIDRILMDRFCYGIKWMYRSACHHIMSNYYEDVTDMIMTYYTGWDICRQLRMCPWFLNDPINAYEAPSKNPYPSLGKLNPNEPAGSGSAAQMQTHLTQLGQMMAKQ